MTKPLWALASGCVPDALPWDIPLIAHSAGFLSSGMWADPETTWDKNALKKTKKSLSDTNIQLIDVEVVWLDKTNHIDDKQKLIIDIGLELKAKNILVVSRHENYEASISQFQEMCERAGKDMRICIEFGEFTNIKSLAKAKEFISLVNHPSAGILIDLMHLNRSGDTLPDLKDELYPYIQGCDFWQNSSTMTGMDYIEAAVDSRCCLGDGEARTNDINLMCQSDKDVSLEIRSINLRQRYPNPFKRAEAIFEGCNKGLFL